MSKLMQLLNEEELTDKITSRAKITFDALVSSILDFGNKPISEIRNDVKNQLEIKSDTTFDNYISIAKEKGFLNDDGTVASEYQELGGMSKKRAAKMEAVIESRGKKFIAPKKSSNDRFEQQIFKILSLMHGQSKKAGVKNSLILTGDPGVGKTSFIRTLAKLVGLPLIPIEAPHITEEHIINIPFMIIIDDKIKKDKATIEAKGSLADGKEFEIVQSESNLVTKIRQMKTLKLKDERFAKSIIKDKILKRLYLNYRHLIEDIRDSYDCILFLDEYYRNDNVKIRNILRNILNGRIGNDKIPKGTFIVYASNIDDEGVEDIPLNNDFAEMEFNKPGKDGWFEYILTKFETNKDSQDKFPGVDLNEKVYNAFYKTISEDDLSYDDEDADVRTSPRRLEQLLLFVNASLPVENVTEARALLRNVEVNFRNYLENTVSDIYPKYKEMVVKLIKDTSDIDVSEPLETHEWKDVLEQQLRVKISLDKESDPKNGKPEVRQYVPVISGEPGIGKTAHASTVANNLDLYFLHVDVSTLTRESVTGIPKAKQKIGPDGKPILNRDGNPIIETEFSKPELLDLIEKMMMEEEAKDSDLPEAQQRKGKGKYKFLLLFDELTRADAQVFNAIRKLMLEKSFNEEYDLPDNILIISALNPVDAGAEELTKHMRDVLDIIPSTASWKKTEKYLLSEDRPAGVSDKLGFDLTAATTMSLKTLLNQYKANENEDGDPISPDLQLFHLRDDGDVIYISPREITDIVTMTNADIENRLTKVGIKSLVSAPIDPDEVDDDDVEAMIMGRENRENDLEAESAEKGIFNLGTNYSEKDFDVFVQAMIAEFRDNWASKLSFICKKQSIDPRNILSVTTGFIMKNDEIREKYDAIKSMEVEDVKTMDEIMSIMLDNGSNIYDLVDSGIIDNYITTHLKAPQKLTQELSEFMYNRADEIKKRVGMEKTIEVKVLNGTSTQTFPYAVIELQELYIKILEFVDAVLRVYQHYTSNAKNDEEVQNLGQHLNNIRVFVAAISNELQQPLVAEGGAKGGVNVFAHMMLSIPPEKRKEILAPIVNVKKIMKEYGFDF